MRWTENQCGGPVMIVDCMTCPVRGQRCDDCAVTVLRAHGLAEHLSSAELELSTELALSTELVLSTELALSTELRLDAAENRVVSMLVGAGLVNAGAVATLRARRESVQHWGTVRDVG